MTFNEGDEVYVVTSTVTGFEIEKRVVTRVTPTLAFVRGFRGAELKFDRETGKQRPRPSAYGAASSIEHPTPKWDGRYAQSRRRVLARSLSYAAQQFERGDMDQADRMEALFNEWHALGKVAAC